MILWVLSQLRAVFRTLRDGQPFVPANATRVRRIAWAVILGEVARSVLSFAASSTLMHTITAEGLRFEQGDIFGHIVVLVADPL